MKSRVYLTATMFVVIACVPVFQPQGSTDELEAIPQRILEADPRNEGIDIEVGWAADYGEGAARISVVSVQSGKSRADVMRVVLMALDRLAEAEPEPSLIVFLSRGTEQLLVEGTVLDQIALNWRAGKPMPAWRLLVESGVLPDGSKFPLPEGLLPRTTAALGAVQLLYSPAQDGTPESNAGASQDSPKATSPMSADEALYGNWVVNEDTDPITDLPKTSARVTAESNEAALIVRCLNRRVDVMIYWKEYLADNTLVTTRFDEGVPLSGAWVGSSSKNATFVQEREEATFLAKVLSAKRLVARITPYNEAPSTETFQLGGAEAALQLLREDCPTAGSGKRSSKW